MINTQIIDSLQLLFENFESCSRYIEKDYKIDDDEPYYRFSTKLVRDLYCNEVLYELETSSYLHDSLKLSHTDDEPSIESWIALNEDPCGVIIFLEHSRNDTRSIIFNTSGQMIFRSRNNDNVVYDIPLTKDAYFNISMLQGIDLELCYIQYINAFLQENKKIIDECKIMLEYSAYEI